MFLKSRLIDTTFTFSPRISAGSVISLNQKNTPRTIPHIAPAPPLLLNKTAGLENPHPRNCHAWFPAITQTTRFHSCAVRVVGLSIKRNRIARPLIVCVISISCGFNGDFYVETGEMGYLPNGLAGDVLAVL